MMHRGAPRSRDRERALRSPRSLFALAICGAALTLATAPRFAFGHGANAPISDGPTGSPLPAFSDSPSTAPTRPEAFSTLSPPDTSTTAAPATPLASATPVPYETPTQPPIIVEPPNAGVQPGGTTLLRVQQVLGNISVTVANPALIDATVDNEQRTILVRGKALGDTKLTVTDSRGLTRDVGIKVALPAGSIADRITVRITGNPATDLFVKEQAIAGALRQAFVRPGATILAAADAVSVGAPLETDRVTNVKVPLVIQGGDQYFGVVGTTNVRVENFAEPAVAPKSLLVSDFPETLRENGTLFSADISPNNPERFLYFHYNPPGQPDRRVVLKATNPSNEPALVQFIAGAAGPGLNEMEVGHASTQRFLVRLAQNEGTVLVVPGKTTLSLYDQVLPAKNIISGLLQLNQISGAALHMTLVAQNATDPVDSAVPATPLLMGDRPHARGIYPIPEFDYEYSYDPEGPDLEIPIGQIPLPNLVQGQTLIGDYGVLQRATIRIYNYDQHNARQIALYANPRGGRATGTFIVDRILLQAHAMQPFGHYKLRQYTVGPGTHISIDVVTIPEGGSSYPLRLVVAPDDGSAAPGSSDSPIY